MISVDIGQLRRQLLIIDDELMTIRRLEAVITALSGSTADSAELAYLNDRKKYLSQQKYNVNRRKQFILDTIDKCSRRIFETDEVLEDLIKRTLKLE